MSSVLVALRRLRTDRAPAIGLGLLVLVTATLFGVAPRLIDLVGDQAVRGVMAQARPFDRNIALIEERAISTPTGDPMGPVQAEGDRIDGRMPASVRSLIGDRQIVIDSPRFQIEGKTPDPSFIRFRVQPGAADRVHYVSGAPPSGVAATIEVPAELRALVPGVDPKSTNPVSIPLLEAAISSSAAHQIDRRTGDTLFLSIDSRDTLANDAQGLVAMRLTGLFDVNDTADPFWYGDQSIAQVGIRSPGGDTKFIDVGALMADDAYPAMVQSAEQDGSPVRYTWRHIVDPDRLTAGGLDALLADLRRLETAFPQTAVTQNTFEGTAMQSGLLPLLEAHQARWASASALLTVVSVGPAIIAFAALALVATMASRRRRPAIALVRGRGATLGQIVRAVFLEGCVIAIPALGLAVLLAQALVPIGSNRETVIAATLVAAVAIGLLIATALPGIGALTRGARDEDAPRGVSPRRLLLDIVVIVLAAGGAWLLRERGIKGASSTTSLGAADPLIALVHLDRASTAAAWHEVGAAYQATAQVGTFSNDFRPADLPGVTDAALLKALQIPVGNRNLRVWLLALDLPAYERIAAGSPADPAAPPTMLGGLGADGAVPVLLSESLAGRSDGMPVGQPFDVIVEGYQYHLRGVDTRATFPTQDPDSLFILASRDQLKSVHPEAPLAATTAFLDAPEGALDGIQAAVADQLPSAVVLGRSTFAQAFNDSPVTAAIFAGIAVAAVVAALYAALAVAAALALSGSARANEVAHLRMVGLSRRDALGLAIVEHGPTVVIAFLVGVLLGLGLFALLEPGLGMDALVGARLEVPLSADPRALGLIFAGMLAIAAVGIGLAAWMQRRGAGVASLRRGAE